MDRVTGALELSGVLLVILAVGWWVAEWHGVPLGLATAGCLLLLTSWLAQGGPTPRRRRKAGERR